MVVKATWWKSHFQSQCFDHHLAFFWLLSEDATAWNQFDIFPTNISFCRAQYDPSFSNQAQLKKKWFSAQREKQVFCQNLAFLKKRKDNFLFWAGTPAAALGQVFICEIIPFSVKNTNKPLFLSFSPQWVSGLTVIIVQCLWIAFKSYLVIKIAQSPFGKKRKSKRICRKPRLRRGPTDRGPTIVLTILWGIWGA